MPQQIDFKPEEQYKIDFQPESSKPKTNDGFDWLDTISDETKKFLNEHPTGLKFIKSLLGEQSPETIAEYKKRGINPELKGPGLQTIPAIGKGFDYIADKIDNPQGEGGYIRGAIAGSLHGLGNLASVVDPRAVGVGRGNVANSEEPPLPKVTDFHSEPIPPKPSGVIDLAPNEKGTYEQTPNAPKPEPTQLQPIRTPHELPELTQTIPQQPNAPIRDISSVIPQEQFKEDQFTRGISNQVNNPPVQLPQDLSQDSQLPSAAKTDKGIKIGADIESLGKVLGSSLYKGNIAQVVAKELAQNSVDAVRHLDEGGKVSVKFMEPYNGKLPYVEVIDNGKGLTKNELETVFTDLGSSGKRNDENASGGFGLAKAAPLLGGEKVEVTSVVNEGGFILKHTFSGTPEQLIKGVDIQTEKVSPNTPTGTIVRTYVPKDTDLYSPGRYIKSMAESSIGHKGQFDVTRAWTDKHPGTTDSFSPSKESYKSQTIGNDYANMEIKIPSNTTFETRQGVPVKVLNNGLYQHEFSLGGWNPVHNAPEHVVVDVKSKVPEGDKNYPFTANRESLRGAVEKDLNKYLHDTIVKPGIENEYEKLRQIYDNMPSVDLPDATGPRKFFIYDQGSRFTPAEMGAMFKDPDFIKLSTAISDVLQDALQHFGNEQWSNKIERVGLIFDPDVKGIYIPRPNLGTTGKSNWEAAGEKKKVPAVILINPFSHLLVPQSQKDLINNSRYYDPESDYDNKKFENEIEEHLKDPDQTASDLVHTILHEIVHAEVGDHNEEFIITLSQVYAQFGARNTVNAQDKFLEAISDPNDESRFNPTFQNLLSKYLTSRGRESTETSPLVSTGFKRENDRDRKNPLPFDDRSDTERIATGAITKLKQAIQEATPIREEQEEMYSEERGKRIAEADKIKSGGENAFYKQLGKLKGQLPKVDFTPIRYNLSQEEIDALFDMITNAPRLLPFEKINAKEGLAKLLGEMGGEVPQRHEIKLLSSVFGKDIDDIIMMHGGIGVPGGFKLVANELINVPKSLMASMDFSAPLRQGLPLIHKKSWWSSLDDMFKAFGSEESFKAIQDSIEERPYYSLGKQAGLFIADGDVISSREEAFLSQYAEKLPGIGHMIRASDRAYMAFLNKLRADTFDSLIDDAKTVGYDGKELLKLARGIAEFVNISTGRGSLGRFEKVAVELNAAFFSPRMIAARIQSFGKFAKAGYDSVMPDSMSPEEYVKMDPMLRREWLKSLLAIAAFTGTIVGLGKLIGGKVETNPLNADFMKVRYGKTRLDPMAGFQQYIVAASRMIMNKEISSTSRKEIKFGEGFKPMNRQSLAIQFGENKLSPIAGFIDVMLKGKDPNGNPIQPKQEVIDRLTPMVMHDFYDIYKTDPKLLPLGMASVFGMGTQTYQDSGKSPFGQLKLN